MQITTIQSKIHEIRGVKVMLDFDLAALYDTTSKRLKEAVRRNLNRFPEDFMFELTQHELESLRTQIATSKRGGIRYPPFAFTKQGVAMISSVLSSEKAISVNISIMRTFVFIRQFALSHEELTAKLQELEIQFNIKFKDVVDAINYLLQKDQHQTDQQMRKKIRYK